MFILSVVKQERQLRCVSPDERYCHDDDNGQRSYHREELWVDRESQPKQKEEHELHWWDLYHLSWYCGKILVIAYIGGSDESKEYSLPDDRLRKGLVSTVSFARVELVEVPWFTERTFSPSVAICINARVQFVQHIAVVRTLSVLCTTRTSCCMRT